jgi:hypothetical protein
VPAHPNEDWISASATRAWCVRDPILDWLELYGAEMGYIPDIKREGYDRDTDMLTFLREKGTGFEAAVMRCIEDQFQIVRIADRAGRDRRYEQLAAAQAGGVSVLELPRTASFALDPVLYEQTLQAMQDGVEMIYQAVVWDQDRQTYGVPDLLVRSDVLSRLAAHPPLTDEAAREPYTLVPGASFHYRVVDIKFSSLTLNSKGFVGNDDSGRKRKAQLLIYNRALGLMQGYEPETAFLMGRGYSYTLKKESFRGDSCLDRLGPADMRDTALQRLVDDATEWARKVRALGRGWVVEPSPSVPELHPNMSNTEDAPWHTAKKEIAERTEELTLLWRVTPSNRPNALQAGISRFTDDRCTSAVFDLSEGYAPKLQRIIEVNRPGCQEYVQPARVAADEDSWRVEEPLEFFVDFETVSSLDDDFSNIPEKGGQALIYMIGCGHMEGGEWKFKCFTCDRLTVECERQILDFWHTHMKAVRSRLWPDGNPKLFHWSHAEESTYSKAYNAALTRHPDFAWPDLNWYDFLVKVVREEPVTVKGALAFGLKAIAKAMHNLGYIETNWTNGPGDGLGAMVGAWRCNEQAQNQGISMIELQLMQSIESYNEVDCRVMQEIISYLRLHH